MGALFVVCQHVAEIPFENDWVVKTRDVDHGTVTHLDNIGVLGQNLLAAHSVWVSHKEVFSDLLVFNYMNWQGLVE